VSLAKLDVVGYEPNVWRRQVADHC
jgi:hypothetical protein